jgi:hypothetical protein
MPFKKGNKIGSKGRPKGSKNFATLEKKQLINFLKEEGAQKFIYELSTLEGKEYCQAYIPVVEIAFPKLSRVESTVDQQVTFTQYEQHDDSELQAEIDRLSRSLEGTKQKTS